MIEKETMQLRNIVTNVHDLPINDNIVKPSLNREWLHISHPNITRRSPFRRMKRTLTECESHTGVVSKGHVSNVFDPENRSLDFKTPMEEHWHRIFAL